MDLNRRLVVSRSGEDLALLGRDGGVALDQLGAYAAQRLDAEGQRGNVEQEHVLDLAAEYAALDGRADGNAFVRVNALEAFLAGDALHRFLNSRDTGRAADQQDLGQVGCGQAGVAHCLTDRAHGALDQVSGQLIELRAGQRQLEVLRAGCVRGDIRLVDRGLRHAGQLDLGLFRSFLQALHSHLIGRQVDAVGLLKLCNHPVDDALVKVVAAEVGIACGGQHFQNALADVEDGNVERAAAKVINHDLLLGFLVYAVCQRRCSRLVDDTQHFETRDLTRVLGRLTLGVGEIGRDRNDRLRYRLAEVGFRVRLQLLEDHCRDLLRGIGLAVDVYTVVRAHVALDGNDGAVRVGHSLALCHLTDHALAVLGERDNRRGRARAFRVRDDDGFAALHNGYARVCRTEVNTNDFAHD